MLQVILRENVKVTSADYCALLLLVGMGNSTARDKSRVQSEPESEGGATIEAPPASDVGITCIGFNSFQKFITGSYNIQ